MIRTYYQVKMTFTEPLLGSQPGNPLIQEEFIASKAPEHALAKEELELAQVGPEQEKSKMIFPHDERGLFLWDYQIRGSFKEALSVLLECGLVKTPSKWCLKRAVDCLLFVRPRRNYLKDASGNVWKAAPSTLQRSLRATTLQGDRVALASSEMLPVGTSVEYLVELVETGDKSKLRIEKTAIGDCLAWASTRGFGQWRSGGYGTFTYEISAAKKE